MPSPTPSDRYDASLRSQRHYKARIAAGQSKRSLWFAAENLFIYRSLLALDTGRPLSARLSKAQLTTLTKALDGCLNAIDQRENLTENGPGKNQSDLGI